MVGFHTYFHREQAISFSHNISDALEPLAMPVSFLFSASASCINDK
jgi:hypothetical protein